MYAPTVVVVRVVWSRAITKEGRRCCVWRSKGADAPRRVDPQLVAFYHRLMSERGHCHTEADVAVPRKLTERTWAVLNRGMP